LSDFGELRSLAHGAPSQQAFHALIRVFEEARAPAEEVESIWLPYALEHVRAWPVYLRTLRVDDPARLGDTPPPWMALLCALHLGYEDYPEGFLTELVSSSRVAGLERLTFDHSTLPAGVLSALATSPHLGALRQLMLRAAGTPETYRALAGSPTLRLESFSAHGAAIGDEGAVAFADSPVFADLEQLGLTACGIGDQGARALGSASFTSRLHRLRLQDNTFGAQGATALLSGSGAPWTHLDLSRNTLGPDAVPALVASGRLGRHMNLFLDQCDLTDDDAVALASSGRIGGLRNLNLRRNRVGDRGAIALAGADLGNLMNLMLEGNVIGAAGALALLRSPNLGSLESLDLDSNACADDDFEPVADASSPGSLREVYLSDSAVGPRLFAEVVATRSFSTVTSFYCRSAHVGAEGGRAFGAREATLSSLEELDLDGAGEGAEPLGDEGFAAMLAPESASRLTELWQLDVGSNGLTDASARVLPGSGLRVLTSLYADSNPLSDGWVRELVSSTIASRLNELNLETTFVTDAGLEHIADSTRLGLLKTLDIVDVRATERGLRALLTSPNLPKLKMLSTTIRVTDETIRALTACADRANLGRLTVDTADLSPETWRALATSPNLASLDFFDFRGDRGPLLDVLDALRSEQAWMCPWTTQYTRDEAE
jgi:hypothetical protein